MTRINTSIIITNGTAWPDPLDPGDAEFHLRRGDSSLPQDACFAADVIAAYRRLIFMRPETREHTVQELLARLNIDTENRP
jgi:hypothetical protein